MEIVESGSCLQPDASYHEPGPAGSAPEWVAVRPLGARVGLLQFEVQRGGMLSEPAALVALPSRAAVAEAQQAHVALTGNWGGCWPWSSPKTHRHSSMAAGWFCTLGVSLA